MTKSPSPACPISFMQWSPKISQMKNCCQRIEGGRCRAGDTSRGSLLQVLGFALALLPGLSGDSSTLSVCRNWTESLARDSQMNTSVKHCWETGVDDFSPNMFPVPGCPQGRVHSCLFTKYIAFPNNTEHLHPNLLMERDRKCSYCSAGASCPLSSRFASDFNSQRQLCFWEKLW